MSFVLPPERRPRRRVRKRRRILPRFLIALVIALALGTVAAALVHNDKAATPPFATTVASTQHTRSQPVARPVQKDLVEHVTGSLPAPLMNPSSATSGRSVLLLGGLNTADVSVASIVSAGVHSARVIGSLPSVRHDTAAATLGNAVYVFGGGNGPSQLSDIVRVDRTSGRSSVVGRLPSASSDSTAAAIGGTAYVVGGYTGTRWLDTIVAYRPGNLSEVLTEHYRRAHPEALDVASR